MTLHVDSPADRPTLDEIEVTPEMIAAGMRALAPIEALPPKTEEALVTEIFSAMLGVAYRQVSIKRTG